MNVSQSYQQNYSMINLSHNEISNQIPFEGSNPTFSKLNSSDHPLLVVVSNRCKERNVQIEAMSRQQYQLLDCYFKMDINTQESIDQFTSNFKALELFYIRELEIISNDSAEIETLFSVEILSPWSIHTYYLLKDVLYQQRKQIEMNYFELKNFDKHDFENMRFCDLIIIKQPFPDIFSKNKLIQNDLLQVRAILSPYSSDKVLFGKVHCSIVFDPEQSTTLSNQKMISNDIRELCSDTLIASFPLKFLQGTRRSKVYCKFVMICKTLDQKNSFTIESELSNPFIVITNESQWDAAEEVLIKWDLFKNQPNISYPYFCNILQRHFLIGTKQDLSHPIRGLSLDDFDYFYKFYFNNEQIITQAQVVTFWSWFGKTLKEIKYQRYIRDLWQNGLIYGCLQRSTVENILKGQPQGTFIIRFSERYPGQFGIAYVKDVRIKHYLVTQNDISIRKTLSDFLLNQTQFLYVLKLAYDENGYPMFFRQTKKESFEKYYSSKGKENVKVDDDGYEPLET